MARPSAPISRRSGRFVIDNLIAINADNALVASGEAADTDWRSVI
ncbi:hypothetical protein [Burkholderia sp. WAC0059]|nr:hypothetical protein [Burkholderia sp. WAC0059]